MDGQALWEERQKQPLGATYKNDVKYLSGGWNSGSVTKREAKTSEFTFGRERERTCVLIAQAKSLKQQTRKRSA
jgi:hypothetical protein